MSEAFDKAEYIYSNGYNFAGSVMKRFNRRQLGFSIERGEEITRSTKYLKSYTYLIVVREIDYKTLRFADDRIPKLSVSESILKLENIIGCLSQF